MQQVDESILILALGPPLRLLAGLVHRPAPSVSLPCLSTCLSPVLPPVACVCLLFPRNHLQILTPCRLPCRQLPDPSRLSVNTSPFVGYLVADIRCDCLQPNACLLPNTGLLYLSGMLLGYLGFYLYKS